MNTCFSKIQLVGQKNIKTKHLSLVKARLQSSFRNPEANNRVDYDDA